MRLFLTGLPCFGARRDITLDRVRRIRHCLCLYSMRHLQATSIRRNSDFRIDTEN
jgi:hypothetical protein